MNASSTEAQTGVALPNGARVVGDRPALVPAPRAQAAGSSLEAARFKHLSKRQSVFIEVLAELLDQPDLDKGLLALANELKARFKCTRVVIALYEKETLHLRAISEQSTIDHKAVESRSLVAAMTEACEQDTAIHFPGERRSLQILTAHRALCAATAEAEVFTIPLAHEGELIGALLLQRSSQRPWVALTTELFEQIAAAAAPIIHLYAEKDRSLLARLLDLPQRVLARLLGPRHLILKTAGLGLLCVLLATHFIQAPHQVRADGELVALERRLITAPVLGYIEAVAVRPGDRVAAGDLLVRLDTGDLELEREKWRNQLETANSEFRAAMASYDRAEMAIVQARQRSARAQLTLVEEQIERAQIRAPGAGIVVSGDLSQSLGAPVERGTELMEIAPELGYEVQLLVDERDIELIAPGQKGQLSLRASPADGSAFTVAAIHPVAESAGGRTVFRVEADLDAQIAGLRPGQTGVGKIAIGDRSLLWSWTHRFTDWLRLRYWAFIG